MKAVTHLVSQLPLAGKFAVQPMTRIVVSGWLRMEVWLAFMAFMIWMHSTQVWIGIDIALRSHFWFSLYCIVYSFINILVVLAQLDITLRVCQLKMKKRKFAIKEKRTGLFELFVALILTAGGNAIIVSRL